MSIDKIVQKHYEKKSPQTVLALVAEQLKKKYTLMEQDEGDVQKGTTVLKLPKFKINEKNWGKRLETEDRAIIEQIGANLGGDTPLARVEYLQQFLDEKEEIQGELTVGKVMGTLMFLDIFASIVYEFNASVAGFLFEALFAGIFEGYQIEAKEGGGEAGTTDVVLTIGNATSKQDVEYSFKLLTKGGGPIKGSATDLMNGIRKSSDASETYLIGLKSGDENVMQIDFYEFVISKDTWFNWIGRPDIRDDAVFGEVQFTFGEQVPILQGKIRLGTTSHQGKVIDGEFVRLPPSKSKDREAFDANAAPLIKTSPANPMVLQEPHNLTHVNGTPVEEGEYLIPGEDYKIVAKTGDEKRADFSKASNFNELYAGYLGKDSPHRFGPNDEDFITYVSNGTYKKDDEFFDHLEKLTTFGGDIGPGPAGQFKVGQNYMMKQAPNVDGPHTLVLDRAKFESAAKTYTAVIGDKIYQVFTDMANLVEDVSGYYLGGDVSTRFEYAQAAKNEADRLAKSTEENFKDVEVDEDTRKALEKSARRREASRGAPPMDMSRGVKSPAKEGKEDNLGTLLEMIKRIVKNNP